ncbi:MAG: hypothetical protein F2664_03580, partial [Actinobacteria bacterium]|nr:hypothetical protein [Actinomycetota bacterium]
MSRENPVALDSSTDRSNGLRRRFGRGAGSGAKVGAGFLAGALLVGG